MAVNQQFYYGITALNVYHIISMWNSNLILDKIAYKNYTSLTFSYHTC